MITLQFVSPRVIAPVWNCFCTEARRVSPILRSRKRAMVWLWLMRFQCAAMELHCCAMLHHCAVEPVGMSLIVVRNHLHALSFYVMSSKLARNQQQIVGLIIVFKRGGKGHGLVR